MVERTLIDLVRGTIPTGGRGRGALWSAALALNASAVVWHRLEPSAGRRFGELGIQLQERVRGNRVPPASAALLAAVSRRGALALERPLVGEERRSRALADLDDAALTLAAIGVTLHGDVGPARRSGLHAVSHALALHMVGEEVAAVAGTRARAAVAQYDAAGESLAVALAAPPPTELCAVDDPGADRVLRAEAITSARAAWVARGALELAAVRRLPKASRPPARRLRTPPHAVAATRAATRSRPTAPVEAASAWRAHTLGLARAAGRYVRACQTTDELFAPVREELIDLLADSLLQTAWLDARLRATGSEGAHAIRP